MKIGIVIGSIREARVGKTTGLVSYGADFQMLDVRAQVSISVFAEFGEGGFTPAERRGAGSSTLLNQLVPLTEKVTR